MQVQFGSVHEAVLKQSTPKALFHLSRLPSDDNRLPRSGRGYLCLNPPLYLPPCRIAWEARVLLSFWCLRTCNAAKQASLFSPSLHYDKSRQAVGLLAHTRNKESLKIGIQCSEGNCSGKGGVTPELPHSFFFLFFFYPPCSRECRTAPEPAAFGLMRSH